jgi:hypothetical protein
VALVVLVPLIGLVVFYLVYTCTAAQRLRQGQGHRHGYSNAWDDEHDSINSGAVRGAAGAGGHSASASGSAHGSSGSSGPSRPNHPSSKSKPKSKPPSKESAAARARRALGDFDADDDWEVPLCIDDVERGADDGL